MAKNAKILEQELENRIDLDLAPALEMARCITIEGVNGDTDIKGPFLHKVARHRGEPGVLTKKLLDYLIKKDRKDIFITLISNLDDTGRNLIDELDEMLAASRYEHKHVSLRKMGRSICTRIEKYDLINELDEVYKGGCEKYL